MLLEKRFFSSLRNLQKPTAIISHNNNIHFNLAFESFLMEVVRPTVPIFFWWRNTKTIVIGRHQNPRAECDLTEMKKLNISLARRFSGGGAVYQDLGNSCFTFLGPTSQFSIEKNNKLILDVIKKNFNIECEAHGRNDLMTGGKKHIKDPKGLKENISLHHGTILIDTNFSILKSILTPNKLKLKSKGVSSVASRVINLKEYNPEISHEILENLLIEEFFKLNNSNSDIIKITKESSITKDLDFLELYNKLSDWKWCSGVNPNYSHIFENRFDWATMQLNLNVENNKIQSIIIFTDSLIEGLVPAIEKALEGATFTNQDIINHINSMTIPKDWESPIKDFNQWLLKLELY